MQLKKQMAAVGLTIALLPILFQYIINAKYTLFDFDMPLEDRFIAFYLAMPNILPYAQPWVHDDEKGRGQIARDRFYFNKFVNSEHNKQVQKLRLQTKTLSVPMRDGVNINVFMYETSFHDKEGDEGQNLRPLYIWIHGGGWVYGEGKDSLLLNGAPECFINKEDAPPSNNVVIASIEYRLPPEHKFPMPTDDTWDALLWLLSNAEELGVDKNRVSIGGANTGANLAAVLVQRAVLARIHIQFQLLLVPVMHYGCATRSCLENALVPQLGAQELVWFHKMYSRHYTDAFNPHYNPLMLGDDCKITNNIDAIKNHGGPTSFDKSQCHNSTCNLPLDWPNTVIITANKDALRDDGRDYVSYLRNQCGVNVIHKELPGSHWSVYRHSDFYKLALDSGVCE